MINRQLVHLTIRGDGNDPRSFVWTVRRVWFRDLTTYDEILAQATVPLDREALSTSTVVVDVLRAAADAIEAEGFTAG